MKKNITNILVIFTAILIGGLFFFVTKTTYYNYRTEKNGKRAQEIWEAIPIWHKKIQIKQTIKIGIINDTHVHASRINKKSRQIKSSRQLAPRYLTKKYTTPINNFVIQMNKFQPEFIIHLGDVIEGTNEADYTGLAGIKLVQEILNQTSVPIYWAVGNHDLRSVTKEQFKKILAIDSLNQVFDKGDYRFIILDANYHADNTPKTPTNTDYIPGKLPPETLKWLKEKLATNKRVFVFMHHAVFRKTIPVNINAGAKQPIENSNVLRNLFNEYRVDGFFNGHIEKKFYEKELSTNFYSLTGTAKSIQYPQSYYQLTIKNGTPNLTMFYKKNGKICQTDFAEANYKNNSDCQ